LSVKPDRKGREKKGEKGQPLAIVAWGELLSGRSDYAQTSVGRREAPEKGGRK